MSRRKLKVRSSDWNKSGYGFYQHVSGHYRLILNEKGTWNVLIKWDDGKFLKLHNSVVSVDDAMIAVEKIRCLIELNSVSDANKLIILLTRRLVKCSKSGDGETARRIQKTIDRLKEQTASHHHELSF